MKKVYQNSFWALLISVTLAVTAGCDPSPQGNSSQRSQQANAPSQSSAQSSSDSPQINFSVPNGNSWLSDGKQVSALDGVLDRKNYYVVLDGSGSMAGGKMRSAKDAIRRFATKVPVDANLGLLAFDGAGVTERVPLGVNNRAAFFRKLEEVDTNSNTPLGPAIRVSYEKIRAQARRQQGYGEYHLVIVTDGEANEGEAPRPLVEHIVSESPVVVHTIGFGVGEDHSLNIPGKVFYTSADDEKGLDKGLSAVLAESDKF